MADGGRRSGTAAVIIPQAGRPDNHFWQFGSARCRCQSAWDRLRGLVSPEDVHVVFESWEFRGSGSGTDLNEAITPCRRDDLVDGNESSKRGGLHQPRNVRRPLSLVGPDSGGRRRSVPASGPSGDLANGAGSRLGRSSARGCPRERQGSRGRDRNAFHPNRRASPAPVQPLVRPGGSADGRRSSVTPAVIIPQPGMARQSSLASSGQSSARARQLGSRRDDLLSA